MEFRNRTSKGGCCGNPAKCAFTTVSGRCMAREEHEATIEPENRPAPNFILVGDFEHINERRQSANKPKRNSYEAFFGDDQDAIDKMRKMKRDQAKKVRDRKRNQVHDRHKGRGRERGFGL